MEDDDKSSNDNYQRNYNLRIDGTPNNKKRPRTKSFENDMYKLSEPQIPTYNNQTRNRNEINSEKLKSSTQECDFPPVSLTFKNEPQSIDRQ